MGNSTEQIRPNLLLLVLRAHALLLFDVRRERARHHSDKKHGDTGKHILRRGKAQLKIRKSKGEIDGKHAGQRRGDPVQIAARRQRNQKNRHDEHHRRQRPYVKCLLQKDHRRRRHR